MIINTKCIIIRLLFYCKFLFFKIDIVCAKKEYFPIVLFICFYMIHTDIIYKNIIHIYNINYKICTHDTSQ